MSSQIKCPQCGAEIELTEALTSQIEQSLSAKYQKEIQKKETALESERKKLKKQQSELEEKQKDIEEQVSERVKSERVKLIDQTKKKIMEDQQEQTQALQEELEEKRKQLTQANKKELDLLKSQRELEEKSENIDLEVQRKIAEQRKQILEDATKKAMEDQLLKVREKEDHIRSLQEQIENLKRRAEVGSQEAQGEALEGQLQDNLQGAFPYDTFEEIKKGARGADILHVVKNQVGKECGRILWESKNTKDFQKAWIEKLKNDQRESGADIAAIVSIAMPKNIEHFDILEDIWVASYKYAIGLATALRQSLIQLKRSELVVANKENLKDVIYNYITSQDFSAHIKAVVTAYKQMQEDLDSEKRSMQRIWKKRETQIQKVMGNVTDIYATIEGLVGTQKVLPDIEPLSLEAIADD